MPCPARLRAVFAAAVLMARCGQTAPSCTYTVTPRQLSLPSGGGGATVNVTTGDSCTWTAVPADSWFAILVSPTRTGSGSLQVVAGPNTTAARNGTLVVAQQVVQVTQPAQQTFALSGRIKEAWVDIGLSGVQVVVGGGGVPPATTDRNGSYAMTGLLPGTYPITFSRPSFQTQTQTMTIAADTTLSTVLNAITTFPLTADDIRGSWAGGGPYPDEPFRLTLVGTPDALNGWYIDRRNSSDSVTGTYSGRALVFRVPVADGVLTFECTVDDERHAHGFVSGAQLPGNYPIQLTR